MPQKNIYVHFWSLVKPCNAYDDLVFIILEILFYLCKIR